MDSALGGTGVRGSYGQDTAEAYRVAATHNALMACAVQECALQACALQESSTSRRRAWVHGHTREGGPTSCMWRSGILQGGPTRFWVSPPSAPAPHTSLCSSELQTKTFVRVRSARPHTPYNICACTQRTPAYPMHPAATPSAACGDQTSEERTSMHPAAIKQVRITRACTCSLRQSNK